MLGCDDELDSEGNRITENKILNGSWYGHQMVDYTPEIKTFHYTLEGMYTPLSIDINDNKIQKFTDYAYSLDTSTSEEIKGTIFPEDELSQVIFDVETQAILIQPSNEYIIYTFGGDIGLLEKKLPSFGDFDYYDLEGKWLGYNYSVDSEGIVTKLVLSVTCNDNLSCSGTLSSEIVAIKNNLVINQASFNAAFYDYDENHGIFAGNISSSSLGSGDVYLSMSSDKKIIAILSCFGESEQDRYCEYAYAIK